MPAIVPTSFDTETPYYRQSTTLEGREYQLEFRYSKREDAWYLSFYKLEADQSRTPLATGIKIVPNIDLLSRFVRADRLPPGELRAFPQGSSAAIPQLSELGAGKRVELVYFESSEV
jgi:hypothetical protein